ncbi:MAG: hypothetical protein IPP77_11105 [Bacteroidetes bacterium]|nr:hypothetical protein [Bacteroidota bacterium]
MRYLLLTFLYFFSLHVFAQMDLLDSLETAEKPQRQYVSYTFKTTRIITGHSIETTKKKTIDFRVSHRFGDIATKNRNYHTLFGFDEASDIGIVVDYGVTENLTLGIGRMKGAGPHRELWNTGIKYRALRQTKDFKIPFTITLFGNVVLSSMLPSTDTTALNYFPKSYEGFSHRLSYTVQALLGIKATEWLSLQLSPTFIWRNLVPYNDQNGLFLIGLSGRARFSKRTAFVFEYFQPIMKPGVGGREYFPMLRNIKNAAYYPPIQIGVEFETGGHVFHVNLSNSAGLLESDFLPYNNRNWLQGQFRFGFTIARYFQVGSEAKGKKYWKKGSVEDSSK